MTTGSQFTGAGLPLLTGVVLFGAVVPVVPTGAAVSAAAAVAVHNNYAVLELLGVLVAGAVGAYAGDVVVYAILRWGGERLSGWIRRRGGTPERLDTIEAQLEQHQISTLLVSRLIPGGRVPVLLAAAVAGYPLRRFIVNDIGAAALWSLAYAAIGLLGGSLFPHPWEGVIAAIAIAVVAGTITGRLRSHHDHPSPQRQSSDDASPGSAAPAKP